MVGKVVWVSLLSGAGVPALYALVIYCSSRAGELRRLGSRWLAAAFGALAAVALLAFAAAIGFALTIIVDT